MSEDISNSKLDQEQLVKILEKHCNELMMAGDEIGFSNTVEALLINIPMKKRAEIEKREKEYKKDVEETVWEYYCGIKLGEYEPYMVNGEVVSPRIEVNPRTDYKKLYRMIHEKLEEAEISWPPETTRGETKI